MGCLFTAGFIVAGRTFWCSSSSIEVTSATPLQSSRTTGLFRAGFTGWRCGPPGRWGRPGPSWMLGFTGPFCGLYAGPSRAACGEIPVALYFSKRFRAGEFPEAQG
ncbi:unnamed protein product [Calypogeia fissa]